MGLVPNIQSKTDFSWTCGLQEVLDNVEFTYMTFQKIVMTQFRNMGKKHQKYSQYWDFPPFVTSQDFFLKTGLCNIYIFMCTKIVQRIRKILWRVSEKF